MTSDSFLALLVIGLAAYRVTRLIVLDVLLDEPRMWVLRKLSVRPPRSSLGQFREGVTLRGSRLPRARVKLAEGLQCTYCVGVWISCAVAALWHYAPGARPAVLVAAVCGIQALLSSWER